MIHISNIDPPDDDDAPVRSAGPSSTPLKKKPVLRKRLLPPRDQSTIQFPYMDLEQAITVVRAFMGAGGVALTREQLAGVMGQSVGSGNFVTKTGAARLFGLLTFNGGRFEITNIGSAIVDTDERRARAARAEAFLKVPLYARAYETFRGRQLPPRPNGLEQAFIQFGVAPKQKTNARLAFDRAAKQAGFFSAGPDRLIEPIIAGVPIVSPPFPDESDEPEAHAAEAERPEPTGLHPFIQGLLKSLPEPDTNWSVEGRAKWLQAAANIFDLMYKGSGDISITSKPVSVVPPPPPSYLVPPVPKPE